MSERREATFCPECGSGVPVDEDGCCLMCGATATGRAVAALTAEREAMRDDRDEHFAALVEAAERANKATALASEYLRQRDRYREALEELVSRCDGEEGVRADGSNIQTMYAHQILDREDHDGEE